MRRRTLLTALPGFAAACTPSLGAFDTFSPHDGGTRRVAHNVAYGTDPRQRLDLYAPDGAERAPVIIFIYGGSWRHGDRSDYNFMGAALAAQGFLVVIPDYRLVPQVRFPVFIEDCAKAARWVQDNAAAYGGDARRLVLMGHSAGAYNAVMLGLDAHYLAEAGLASEAVKGVIGLAGPYDFFPFDVPATQNAFGQAPDAQLTQPVHYARADAPPLLLLWGADDTTVGPRNIESLGRVMREADGPVETKIYPGIDHIEIMLALSRPFRGKAPVLADSMAFARRVTSA